MRKIKNKNISQALILAAGFGSRLRPLTLKTPKPLLEVNEKPILFYILEELRTNNISRCFINVHYLPQKIIKFVNEYSNVHKTIKIIIVKEKNILDTGGAIKNIANLYNDKPLLVINGDSLIVSKKCSSPLKELIYNFDIKFMDYLLLLDNNKNSIGYDGKGDFQFLNKKLPSNIKRSTKNRLAYTGWQIVNPKPILKIKNKKFSLNICYDQAIKNNLLWGIINKEKWLHIGTKKSLIESEIWIKKYK